MSDWIAIASLVATPSIVAVYSLMQKRYELQRADRQELRTMLDEASHAFADGTRITEDLDIVWWRGGEPPPGGADEHHRAQGKASVETRAALDRLGIRVGRDSDVYRAYETALKALGERQDFIVGKIEARVAYDEAESERQRMLVAKERFAYVDAATAMVATMLQQPPWLSFTVAGATRGREG